jgi:RimJ/RimL family protein N-acetyltransferase
MRRYVPKVEDVFADLPQLQTERLLLRRVTMDDAADLFEYGSDPEVTRYTTWEPHESIEDSKRYLEFMLHRQRTQDVAEWGMVLKAANKLIGTCGFSQWSPYNGRAEVAYAMARPYWGQGLTTEALTAVVEFGFTRMALNRIEARCVPENVASARVMEKVGMQFEGILREHTYAKGHYYDVKMYSLLRREWSAAQSCANF